MGRLKSQDEMSTRDQRPILSSPKRWKRRYGWPSLVLAFLLGVGLTLLITPDVITDAMINGLDMVADWIDDARRALR